jgi:hypothetical protein
MTFRAPARLGLLLTMALLALTRAASAAGGAYAVDDAGVDPGTCKVESSLSFASNSDFIALVSPACAFQIGRPIEVGVTYARTRGDREWGTSLSPKAKINILPIETGKIGLAVSALTSFDMYTGENTGTFVNVPVTFALTDDFRINVNGGWFHDRQMRQDLAVYGVGVEWSPIKTVTLIAEMFGFAGPSTERRTDREPRGQAGIRFTPVEQMDIDLIYGRNLTGENAHWVTLGLNYRFAVVGK